MIVRHAYEGTATVLEDYEYLPPALVVTQESGSRLDVISVRNDDLTEGDETLSISVPEDEYYTSDSEAINVIIDDCAEFEPPTATSYPFGEDFVLGLYALYEEYGTAAENHWNLGHTYQEAPVTANYFDTLEVYGLDAMARLSYIDSLGEKWAKDNATVIAEIVQQSREGNLAWWDMPEELRYWVDNEFDLLKMYSTLTRTHDPFQRPNFMYIPGTYDADAIANYLPYLDIIPASCYPNWQGQPNAYVRWSIDRTRRAISENGYTEGSDYLNGEKTVMAILELFDDSGMTVQGTWHDYWLSIAAGADGILVFSHFYRDQSDVLSASWEELNRANALFKEYQLGEVFLNGSEQLLTYDILSGPVLGPELDIDGIQAQYPSLTLRAVQYNEDELYVIAVNSAEEEVVAQAYLPWNGSYQLTDLEANSSSTADGDLLSLALPPLGVGLWKLTRRAEDKVSYIDTTNILLKVNGEDFLPMGFYAEGMDFQEYPDFADRIAAGGFNAIYTESTLANEAQYDNFFGRCEDLGLYNILGLPYTFLGDDPAFYVDLYKDYPSIMAWNILDDANNFGREELDVQRQAVMLEDNTRVASGSWYTDGPLTETFPTVELAMMQSYPWGNGTADLVASHAVLLASADTARLLGRYPIATPQAFNWDDETYPSPEHLYCQSYLCFATGNKGIYYYTFKDYDNNSTIDVTQPELWANAQKVADEVLNSELRDVFLYGTFEHGNIDFYRYYGHWSYNGEDYYIVLNANKDLTYDYAIDVPEDVLSVNPLFADHDNPLTLVENQLVGALGPYEVAIYKTNRNPVAVKDSFNIAFLVYPNPSSEILYIKGISDREVKYIRTLDGQDVYSTTKNEINIADLPGGMYIISVHGSTPQRFIKI